MFHLAWFTSISSTQWTGPYSGTNDRDWMRPDFMQEMARTLDRAGFDFMMLEDSSVIFDVYENSTRFQLARGGSAPKQDPMPYVPLIAGAAQNLGVIATINTTTYHPYLAARLAATLDNLTDGRVGFNLVTGNGDRAAQNFGRDTQIEHGLRYTMGSEWMDAVGALLESWEPDAVVLDHEAYVYADHTKVHPVNFEGEYFKTRGPLATQPGPQRRITICQAGGSPAGRTMAAKHADTIVTAAHGIPAMKAFRDDIRARATAVGRDPDSIKVMFLISPIIGDTHEMAVQRRDLAAAAKAADVEKALYSFSGVSGIDFARFDLDAPIPDSVLEETQGHTSLVAEWFTEPRKTVRELVSSYNTLEAVELLGTPDEVAEQMGDVIEQVGGDGFLIANQANRRNLAEIGEGLARSLRRRGLIRDGFGGTTLRENLLEF